MSDRDEYYEKAARGDVVSYINERKKKATLEWCYNSLKKMVEYNQITPEKIENIITDIENNSELYWLDKRPLRKEKLENLKKAINDKEL